MSYFSNKIHPNGRFSLGSKGHDMQRTHGLALCGINVSAIDCKRYVEDSSYEIRQSCPYSRIERPKCLLGTISVLERYAKGSRGARVYTESCSIRYELYNFFSQHELYNFIHKCNKEWGEIEKPHGTCLAQA
ncbi:hypothetical protein FEM48_Zijuj04G0085700 [Ziziphus jujuba var. spinosa]|uniref:Gnk2-homologous domain-containing protein n=1 Tax=Ziziphus jujuba var. spinosa TaxID=714518 RepID=A0A978VIV5_ZIZJJ|nr:hypothetical protein FEM48_Zijuj04G0085700 [Ziziphus jujuba var. spinosa]